MISSFLQLGYLLKANVSIPRPCKTLSRGHTKNSFDCSLGWGHYVTPSPFIEFDSFADVKSFNSPSLKYPCEDLVNVTSAFLNHMRELPPANVSFCYALQGNWWIHWSMAITKLLLRLKPKTMSYPFVTLKKSSLVDEAARSLLRHLGVERRKFGIVKIRRGDQAKLFWNCSSPHTVLETMFENIMRNKSSASDVEPMPWLVFGVVEPNYFPTFQREYEQSPLYLQNLVTKLLFEPQMTFGNQSLHAAFPDNYFLVLVILKLFDYSAIAITSYYHEGTQFGYHLPLPACSPDTPSTNPSIPQHDYLCKDLQYGMGGEAFCQGH